jgi:tRNA threonylcarbamoyladenosine biosynthesis protein TsaE
MDHSAATGARLVDRTRPPAAGTLVSDSLERTRAIGRALGSEAAPGTFIALVGPLGAGKTQLAKGVAEGLGVTSIVNSPTFILMNEHPGRLRLFHIDAYRLGDPEEAFAAGLIDERQGEGVTVLEWADRLAGWLPDERLEIELVPVERLEERRRLRWTAHGTQHEHLAATALDGAAG